MMSHMRDSLIFWLLLLVLAPLNLPGQAKSPTEFMGRAPGTDFELAGWDTIGGWFDQFGESTPTAMTLNVGTSTEGRPVRICVISSKENLANLDRIKEISKAMADPRELSPAMAESLVTEAVPVVFVSCNMHSTEIAAAEWSMTLAWDLGTSDAEVWKQVRDEVVTVIIPTVNPDGLDRVVNWYRRIVGTPYEDAYLPELYQLYAGHDNNRDWFALSLEETKIVTRMLYKEWFPTIYWDVHQQGSLRERMFVPPFRDPLNPNLHPLTISGIGALGSRAMLDMTAAGFTGISSGVSYDMWWNGGNRNVPVRHNIIGILSEAASANLASPIWIDPSDLIAPRGIETGYAPSNRFPAPWPGGWWRVGDIHRYTTSLGESLLGSVAREPETWVRNSLRVARDVVQKGRDEAPRFWLIQPGQRDANAVSRILTILDSQGVEMFVAQEDFEGDGRPYSAGTLILPREQPYGSFLKDLFEVQRYPDGPAPYDVAGWTLPLLFGIERVEILQSMNVPMKKPDDLEVLTAALSRTPENSEVIAQLGEDHFKATQLDLHGTQWVREIMKAWGNDQRVILHGGRKQQGVSKKPTVLTVSSEKTESEKDSVAQFSAKYVYAAPPRVGVYAPYVASKDEGWLRWVLDHYEIPFKRIRNEQIRAGRLEDFIDVLIIPDISERVIRDGRKPGSVFPELAGGLSPEGVIHLESFVQRGGRLICCGRSTDFAVGQFNLPLVEATQGTEELPALSCPGSILRTLPVEQEVGPWTHLLPEMVSIFHSGSRAWHVADTAEEHQPEVISLLEYPRSEILLSGYAKNTETISGASTWVTSRVGDGRLHLFGFRPHYRSWPHGNFELLMRAIFFSH